MTIHLEFGSAEACVATCNSYIDALNEHRRFDWQGSQSTEAAFDTARQIGTVYDLFTGTDLRTLLNDHIDQAKAMATLFAVAGGLLDAQDEQAAAVLAKAAEEPIGLQSLGLMESLGGAAAGSLAGAAFGTGNVPVGNYDYVGPEEVSAAPLSRLVSGAQALDPAQYVAVGTGMREVAGTLREAAAGLRDGLTTVLGGPWQGEFASSATTPMKGLVTTTNALADSLDTVAAKADLLQHGFATTRERIATQAAEVELSDGGGFSGSMGGGAIAGGTTRMLARQAATEQARAIINTAYSPAVMDANLTDVDFPRAYRVASGTAIGPDGIDLTRAWNGDGVIRPARPADPSAAAIAAAGGVGAGAGIAGVGAPGVTTTSSATAPVDATTEQALLASRSEAGAGAVAGPAGTGTTVGGAGAGAGGPAAGVNAATTAAAAPMFAGPAAAGQGASGRLRGGAPGGIIGRGARPGDRGAGRDGERGFGSAGGLLGGGGAGAAGAGAAAARMGGAGTLAGLGSGAGGVSAGPVTGSAPAGAFSSSSPGGATGAAGSRPGMVPMGMMGAAGAGQGDRRTGHTPAGYLVNATNTSEIVGEPPKAAPAVLGRTEAPRADPGPGTGQVSARDGSAQAEPGPGATAAPVPATTVIGSARAGAARGG
ncbi:hypothetical protein [Dietzia sp. 179-F 9C3 NHS]|uniref:hypothetical protein n=1 Tax=Dietzia sp. 179-F 9C3 NHS TaxID=3374295 RepID=UPI0038799B56